MAPIGGDLSRHSAIIASDRAAIARPASAALMVGALMPDWRARSAADQPLRASSRRSRCGFTLMPMPFTWPVA